MGKGLALPLLIAMREAYKGATPSTKITPPGMLQYLLAQSKPNVLSIGRDDGSGYLRDVKLRYKKRVPPGKTSTTDDCSIQARPAYSDVTLDTTLFRKYAILLEDATVSAFERDAMAVENLGKPATNVMKEMVEAIMEAANGVLADVNGDLLGLQVAAFGKNAVSGSNAARTVNFPLDATTNPLNAGMNMVMADAMENEIMLNGACIVGSGLVNNYMIAQAATKGVNQSGLSTPDLALPKFYFDPYARTAWGANQFGLFEKDAVQFINICRFRGPKGGQRGADEFGTIILPLSDSLGNAVGNLEFDWQKRIITCPTEVVIGDDEAPTAVGRGTVIDLMCSYHQVNIPADSYDDDDRLTGNNGTLRYTATNA